ncbi:MAG: c-type cytochrome [Hydrogenophilaceae bacterium]|nr:c-type cytochrome [Hydrogenophilaceae bacterium]
MKPRTAVAIVAALSAAGLYAAPTEDPLGEKTGGETTVYATGRNAFSFHAANLTDEERTRFVIGNSFFKRNWVEAPASTTARDGLGPHFIARSCGGCHVNDGRGEPPKPGEQPVSLLLRLSLPGVGEHGGIQPEPTYGDQFNVFAVQNVKPEGKVAISHEAIKGRFADGTPYTLQKPHYRFRELGYGPMVKDVLVSPRVAPQIIGVGLLEAIPEAEILRNASEQAAAKGAIKGVANRVWDAPSQKMMLGRFGWKANVATIAHQTVGAFQGDIGITSSVFPNEACTAVQKDCLVAPRGSQGKAPEIDDKTLADVVFYQATLAPPARRAVDDPQVLQGQKLFNDAQCASCHRPSYVTAASPNPQFSSKALSGQRIHPYTDLLLHDMGEALADGRPDGQANGRQWKTPPLWGVGLIRDVNGHNRLLHDGRARGVLEAILWHGGEAEASRDKVLKLSRPEREALVKFVESL